MSFKGLLKIDESLLEYGDREAFKFCEQRWERAGRPVKRWDVIPFIESLIKEFIALETPYPRVLLLRKKELQRKTFTLNESVPAPKANAPICAACSGLGWRQVAGGGHTPCECGAGEPYRKQLAGWTAKTVAP
jgi:hypothetical protein